MNLVPAIGRRTVYTWAEVCEQLGMKLAQVQWRVQCNQLVKRYVGQYPFDQQDLNEFLVRLNNGKFAVARRGGSKHVGRQSKTSGGLGHSSQRTNAGLGEVSDRQARRGAIAGAGVCGGADGEL